MATKTTAKKTAATKPVRESIESVSINQGVSMQQKIVPVLIGAVVLTSFVVGLLYGKVSVYEKQLGGGDIAGPADQQQAVAPPSGDTAPPPQENLSEEAWAEVIADAEFVKGPKDAKVTMVEFTDYQCPFCGRYFSQAYGEIMRDYVDTGKVQYITRDLPLSFHENAKTSALAARCAGDQGKFFEMHDKLFEAQESWSTGDPREKFIGYANDIGIKAAPFTSCYDNGDHNEAIDADAALAAKVGATGTPSFFINGQLLVGAQPYATFQAAIDAALAE